jgi:hypothetical protein
MERHVLRMATVHFVAPPLLFLSISYVSWRRTTKSFKRRNYNCQKAPRKTHPVEERKIIAHPPALGKV